MVAVAVVAAVAGVAALPLAAANFGSIAAGGSGLMSYWMLFDFNIAETSGAATVLPEVRKACTSGLPGLWWHCFYESEYIMLV